MERSLWAVLAGTFTLRFSTGLTGAMLGAYLATLPDHGGEPVSPVTVGLLSATFYIAELVLSPLFGIQWKQWADSNGAEGEEQGECGKGRRQAALACEAGAGARPAVVTRRVSRARRCA